jgi:hypothetical protein
MSSGHDEGGVGLRLTSETQGDHNHMKKIMGLMLGLSLALGCVAFADDAATTATKTKATKTHKTHAKKTKAANADTTAK